jgi:integrase
MGDLPITRVGEDQWSAYPVWRKTEGGNIVIRKGQKAKNGEAALPEEKKIVPAKDGTIRQEMKTFRAILNFAADRDYIRERQIPRGNIPLEDDSREAFTPTEYKHLHTHARNEWIEKGKTAREVWYRRMAYELMLIMANTGMRPSEARNLRWRDFDTRKAKDGREFVCLKVRGKGKHRELVATPNLAAYLERVRELAKNLPPFKNGAQPAKREIKLDDFIFCNAKGASATELYDTVISDLLKDAGLLIGPMGSRRSTYCFRHTYATFRLIEGVDVIWLAKQMGTSVKMIEKHYGHITPTTDAGRILQGTPGWEPIADGSGGTTAA